MAAETRGEDENFPDEVDKLEKDSKGTRYEKALEWNASCALDGIYTGLRLRRSLVLKESHSTASSQITGFVSPWQRGPILVPNTIDSSVHHLELSRQSILHKAIHTRAHVFVSRLARSGSSY